MVTNQKKSNVLAILFFLAVLFVALGFEHSGALAGFAVRQSAIFPETWYLSCNTPSATVAGQDLGSTLFRTYGCQRGKTQTYCNQASNGLQLPKKITTKVSCFSLADKQTFIRSCEQQVLNHCSTKPTPARTIKL
ncbi:MAG TPA: hypothetical protein VJH37_00015 [Candidatus Nanoarchaeia archaeon]|nr:hypothetical protein [Candidatus Nanoarchaeia archaeon]